MFVSLRTGQTFSVVLKQRELSFQHHCDVRRTHLGGCGLEERFLLSSFQTVAKLNLAENFKVVVVEQGKRGFIFGTVHVRIIVYTVRICLRFVDIIKLSLSSRRNK